MPKQKDKAKKATKTKTSKPAVTVDEPKKTSSLKFQDTTW
jgi:hypothetical protein